MFSSLPNTNLKISLKFMLSSANAFNLEKSKTLSFGNELSPLLRLLMTGGITDSGILILNLSQTSPGFLRVDTCIIITFQSMVRDEKRNIISLNIFKHIDLQYKSVENTVGKVLQRAISPFFPTSFSTIWMIFLSYHQI